MFIADFHIHSKYSRATSKEMDIENLSLWAKLKGVNLLGTGDFTHPGWLKELREKLEPAEQGLFRLKDAYRKENTLDGKTDVEKEVRFLLTAEISNM